MPYCRLHDLYAAFGKDEILQRTDDGTGAPDFAVVKRSVENADAEIDAALAGRYKTPMSPVPMLVKRISADIARWFLYDDVPTDEVKERAKLARDLLRALASGEMTLGEAEVSTQASFARMETSRQRMRWSGRR